MVNPSAKTIDAYIANFPDDVQVLLRQMRETLRAAAPEAQEGMSYQIPTFKLHGNLVHFAAFKNHIGFYPAPAVIEKFADELKPYVISKGAIRFPKNQPLPLDLITRIVQERVQENLAKRRAK